MSRCPRYYLQARDRELLARVEKELLADPQALLSAGVLYKIGRRGHSAKVTLAGREYFLKQYYSRGGIYRFIDLFRGSRGLKAWRVTLLMLDAGLAVPRPLIYAEERQGGIWQNGYLLMEFVEGAEDFRQAWNRSDHDRRMTLARSAGVAVAGLHKNRFVHGDLKWYNILCLDGNEEPHLVFSDLDGARFLRFGHCRAAVADTARFLADFAEVEDGRLGHEQFMQSYRAAWR